METKSVVYNKDGFRIPIYKGGCEPRFVTPKINVKGVEIDIFGLMYKMIEIESLSYYTSNTTFHTMVISVYRDTNHYRIIYKHDHTGHTIIFGNDVKHNANSKDPTTEALSNIAKRALGLDFGPEF